MFLGGTRPSGPLQMEVSQGSCGRRPGSPGSDVRGLVFQNFVSRFCLASGRWPIALLGKLHVECVTNHVWGSLGARDMNTFVKRVAL